MTSQPSSPEPTSEPTPTPHHIPGVSDTTIQSCAEDYAKAEPARERLFETWRNGIR